MAIKKYSKIFMECFEMRNGVAVFEKGNTYNPEEMALISGLNDNAKLIIHKIKAMYAGEIIKPVPPKAKPPVAAERLFAFKKSKSK